MKTLKKLEYNRDKVDEAGEIICPFAGGFEMEDFDHNFLDVLEEKYQQEKSAVVFDLRKSFGNDLEGVCDFLDCRSYSESLRDVLLFENDKLTENAYVSVFGNYNLLENSNWIPYPEFHPRHFEIPMVTFLFADKAVSGKASAFIQIQEAKRVCRMFYGKGVLDRVELEYDSGRGDWVKVVNNVSGIDTDGLEWMINIYRANRAGLINRNYHDFMNILDSK